MSGTVLLLRCTATCHVRFCSDGGSERSTSDERHCGSGAQLWHLQTGLTGTRGKAKACRIRRYWPCRPPAGRVCIQQGQTEGMINCRKIFGTFGFCHFGTTVSVTGQFGAAVWAPDVSAPCRYQSPCAIKCKGRVLAIVLLT